MKISINFGLVAMLVVVMAVLYRDGETKLEDANILHAAFLIMFAKLLWWKE